MEISQKTNSYDVKKMFKVEKKCFLECGNCKRKHFVVYKNKYKIATITVCNACFASVQKKM